MEKVYEINVNSIKYEAFLLENVNHSNIRLETLITNLTRILMAVNQINSLIEKDRVPLFPRNRFQKRSSGYHSSLRMATKMPRSS